MFRKLVALASIFTISTFCLASADQTNTQSESSSSLNNNYSPESIRKLESNAFRRVFPNEAYIQDNVPLSSEQLEKAAQQAIQDLSVKEGEALTDSEKRALAKRTFDNKINNALNINAIKTSFFNGFRVSETFTHAMLNTQQDTGDPLFMLQARQQGILADDYIYMGAKLAVINWQRLNKAPLGGETKLFTYSIEAYAASTISKWFSALAGFTLYQDHRNGFNITPNTIYLILGNLSESPFFGYVANSTVMYGNFDIVSNYVPTLTRTYFMQSGGNINLSYHTQDLHLNAVLLDANPNSYFNVTNAGSKSGVGFALNSKYIYQMEKAGDYQFLGLAYSNVSGFQTKNGGNVGAFDINYGLAVSDINFEAEALITDKGVGGINNSSSVSPNNIAGVPFFGSVGPSAKLIYDGFLGSGANVASWSAQTSYTATVFNRRVIPYVDYSQILQNTKNYSYQYGAGFRVNVFYGSWLGLDYTNINSRSSNFKETQNYLSINYTLYL
ncbi:hypothetical protein [Francisella hispaniensis]|uniref:hypothetical protein n=1 Tax=Francisella hispaniensis TaxID=622488 RepID=UPI001908DED2|nr:hypothetical protein [Francisella hispaniensis]MBK2356807.1 hypothetical protein [Francisella hispaniensis]